MGTRWRHHDLTWDIQAMPMLHDGYPIMGGDMFCRVSETVYDSTIEVTNHCLNWFRSR
jgi:hypothetical protein